MRRGSMPECLRLNYAGDEDTVRQGIECLVAVARQQYLSSRQRITGLTTDNIRILATSGRENSGGAIPCPSISRTAVPRQHKSALGDRCPINNPIKFFTVSRVIRTVDIDFSAPSDTRS